MIEMLFVSNSNSCLARDSMKISMATEMFARFSTEKKSSIRTIGIYQNRKKRTHTPTAPAQTVRYKTPKTTNSEWKVTLAGKWEKWKQNKTNFSAMNMCKRVRAFVKISNENKKRIFGIRFKCTKPLAAEFLSKQLTKLSVFSLSLLTLLLL